MIRFVAVLVLSLFVLTGSLQAGKYNPTLSIGDKAPEWKTLPGVDGKTHSLSELKGKAAVVVVFTCNSCPFAVDYEDRMIAFTNKHAGPDSNVALVAINVNNVDADLLPKMKERAKQKKFPFAYLYDESQQIARNFGAGYTPEFFVLNKDRKVIYMGAMDDNLEADKVNVNYLELAVQAALKNGRPGTTETPATGCRVRYERKRRRRKK